MDTISIVITTGTENKKTVLNINKNASVGELLKKISDWNGIPEGSQRVLFAGKQLQTVKNGKTQFLTDYRIEDRSQLFVVFQLPGGQ